MVRTCDTKQHFISPTASIAEAIQCLNDVQPKLLLATSIHGELLGTITDGDIRRALLKHLSMDTSIHTVMNRAPKVLGLDGTQASARRLMDKYGLNGVPQLDAKGRVKSILGLRQQRRHHDNAVFLMAGGFGKRLRPLTNDCPKPMLKVGDKPILETILDQFIDCGFRNFFISTHYLNEQIETYFGDGSNHGVSIKYIQEDVPLGTAGAIGLLPEEVKAHPILMMNGDLLTQVKFDELLEYHINEGSDLTVAVREYQMQVPFGVIQHDASLITNITEKPIQNYFINAGIYCISPEVASGLKGGVALDMPDLINRRLKLEKKVTMFPIHEYWLDIGRLEDFQRAQNDVLRVANA